MLFNSKVTLLDAESPESIKQKAMAKELLLKALTLLAQDDQKVAEFLDSYTKESAEAN